MRRARQTGILTALGALALAIPLASGSLAQAALPPGTVGSFPLWSGAASSTPGLTWEGTATFAPATAFPATTVTTNATSVQTPSGDSAFLGASTGFGANFGSSRSQPYLSLSPVGTTPSTTTITFAADPPAGWGLAVGDVDADFVEIVPRDAGGTVLPGSVLVAQDTALGAPLLNYCNNSPKPSGCSGTGPYTDAPVWWESGTTIGGVTYTTPIVEGNGSNTFGAYDWFLPASTVRSITLIYHVKIGFPTFQVWLAAPAVAATITGTITPPAGTPVPPATVLLENADATPVLDITGQPVSAPVAADGTFSLVTQQAQYALAFVVPAGFDPIAPIAVNATTATVALGAITLSPTAVAAPAAPPVDPQLAATGTDAALPVALAVAALLLGALAQRRTAHKCRTFADLTTFLGISALVRAARRR